MSAESADLAAGLIRQTVLAEGCIEKPRWCCMRQRQPYEVAGKSMV